jgi:hypothetical protein
MKKFIKYSLITLGLAFFLAAALIFRPVPIVPEDRAIVEKGVVSEIYANQGNDIVFLFENKQRKYYINRGLENDLELEDLKQRLIGKEIVIKYPKYWTPLDWNNEIRHLSKVEFEGEVIFNELYPASGN